MSRTFKKHVSKSLSDLSAINTTFDRSRSLLCGSFEKLNKKGKLPQRYYGCKRRRDFPTKEGFLCVQCLPDVKWSWKLRYVMLFHDKLCYMKSKTVLGENTGSMDFNAISISDIISLKISSDCQMLQISDSETFYVKTSHGRTLFRCRDEEERDKWITALLTAKSSDIMKERENHKFNDSALKENNFTIKCLPYATTFWFTKPTPI